MKFIALLSFLIFATITICSADDSKLLQIINRMRRSGKGDKNGSGSGADNQNQVNFGFPTFGDGNGGSWPQFGLPQHGQSNGGQVAGSWPQFGGGNFGGNLHGRFAFDKFPDIEGGKGQQVSSGVSCTYNKEGKEKCTHHRYNKNKN
ncbi:uncharacterized protein LOC129765193 [Toxorhynchites rutilus septentrionalis]|uniref:uncharacterized protein LOC129765193 n=1 Tax=Toxorhynchites rutilus septentrionalis TaxID=329112 RepID=UPI00247A15A1|nr:uncharacterized protein LOC129765193 [Toxorhynchites rutilus septentrionalis]